jgi:hypothetical protein
MTLALPTHIAAVRTCGVAVLPVTWSEKLRRRLAGTDVAEPSLRILREAYEGLPSRLVHSLAGEQIVSNVAVGVSPGWHRQRVDTILDGAPASFIPGMCIAGPTGEEAVVLSYVPGSARSHRDIAGDGERAVEVELAPGDVAVLDSRCARRWSRPEVVFALSVVRSWIEPQADLGTLVRADTLARVARFAGRQDAPAVTVREWLFERHERRPAADAVSPGG